MTTVSREKIFDEVRRAIVELFEIDADRIALETRVVEDLDLDSIDAIELAVRMETLTGRRLDPERFREMRTIGDVVEIVYGLLDEPAVVSEAS
jgi:acyl carrier protein